MSALEPIHPARYWHALTDGRLQCDLCPRACRLHDGQAGSCFVRSRYGSQMVLDTYGRSSGFCVDPVEKKPLHHFLPGTPVLSFGTAGCNLACRFCQNWHISKSRQTDSLCDAAAPAEIAEAALRSGCTAVAFTYNDPTIFLEYAVDTAHECHKRGIRTIAVTAGYINPKPARELFGVMDAANIDLKAFTERFYHDLCAGSLKPVLDTLLYVKHETTVWLEITNLVIPGENDTTEELDNLSRWVATELGPDVPLHFTAFHPDWRLTDHIPTPLTTLRHARAIARANGLRYVYTGNVPNPEGAQTICHRCNTVLIRRHGYEIDTWRLTSDGRCMACGEPCAGVFHGPPGDWGSRRQPVRIG